jgi:hypothetical protein
LVNFTQRAAAEMAQDLTSTDFLTKVQKQAIAVELGRIRFDSPYGKEAKRFLAHGIGLHHAGLLPKYRLLVERLAQKALLAIVSGTDTLGVGVNVPIRTVLFTQLCKFDGQKTAILGVREFQQIAGRAGRKGFDDEGFVLAQAPEHVIENLRMQQKAAGDPVKLKRIVRKKPPEKGFVPWDRAVFDKLVRSQPEPLESRFRVTYGMILNVLGRPGAGCLDVARIVHRSHERPARRRILGREARAIFDSLVAAGIVTIDAAPRRVAVHVDLQEDFSLHHALSLWLVEALGALDVDSPSYAFDVLSLVEAILEDPVFVLRQQLEVLKRAKLAELKASGVEYDERIIELEKLEHPKPLREFTYESFNAFARLHPWVQGDNIRPKSIAREMAERFMTFNEYVREYELGRAEGTLLRHLSDAYKTLVQTVPAPAKTPEVEELETFLRAIVRSVDSSLLDEWERMRSGAEPDPPSTAIEHAEPDLVRDERAFVVLLRAAMFQLTRALARKEWSTAASLVESPAGEEPWSAERLAAAMAPFFDEKASLRLDPQARGAQNTRIDKTGPTRWQVTQILCDDAGDDDWFLSCSVDLEASRDRGRPVVALTEVNH